MSAADASLAECGKAFEAWGAPWLDAFDVDVARDPVVDGPPGEGERPRFT